MLENESVTHSMINVFEILSNIGHISGISEAYLMHNLGISWVYHGHILGISWAYTGHILGISWAYIGHIFGKYWAYLGHLLVVVTIGCQDSYQDCSYNIT